MDDVELCALDDLVEGRGWPVTLDGRRLAVFLEGGQVYVIDNRCLHQQLPLDSAAVADGCLVCPWHGWTYRLSDGALVTTSGVTAGLPTVAARIEGGVVKAELKGVLQGAPR